MNQRYFNRISIKLVLVITGALFITLLAYTLVTASRMREQITNSWATNAYAMSDIIKKSARHSMLLNRTEDVNEIVKTVGGEQNVKKIRIYNKFGKISYSTDSTEIGKKVALTSYECRACHVENQMTVETPQDKMIRIFKNDKNEKVLGLINPIRNEQDCSESGCHPADKKLLGVLDVVLTTDKIDEQVASNVKTVAIGSVFIMILIALSAGTAIAVIVNRPMKRIDLGMKEIADGNLNYQIDVHTKDDLGAMAEQFNDMSQKLNEAYGEIKQWNATLNKKVEDKNEELKKIYEQIVQVEKLASLGKLSATVAHELNNPLEGILTYSKLIAKMLAKENQNEKYEKILKYLELISSESSRCGRIVKDLLVFSRSSDTQFLPNDLRDIVEKDILLIKHHLEMHHVILSKFMDKGPVPVFCDSQKIEQALLSVLINAIESMQDGCKLTVVATKIDGNGVVLIQDQGPGIAADVLPHIFDPFFSTKKDKKGTGLGLSVAYGIITQHKGTIEVSETSERGTVFKIQLPLYKQESVSA
jgi:two-component system NtrC family sensor kinase